jgi:hypothetical protein
MSINRARARRRRRRESARQKQVRKVLAYRRLVVETMNLLDVCRPILFIDSSAVKYGPGNASVGVIRIPNTMSVRTLQPGDSVSVSIRVPRLIIVEK